MEKKPIIYVVATPIGNLDDLSPRAIKTLKQVDVIAAEDTRTAKKLLAHAKIEHKEIISYYDEKEQKASETIIKRLLASNEALALISDAGTPAISDPGYRLVRLARKHGIRVCPIPGPSSVVSLASASGLPTDRLYFCGFLPTKSSRLKDEIASFASINGSIIFFESARRIKQSLRLIVEAYPNAEVCIGRELTKLYEEIHLLSVQEALRWVEANEPLKGELCLMLSIPKSNSDASQDLAFIDQLKSELDQGATLKDLLKRHRDCGLSRSKLYQLLLDLQK